MQRVRWDQSREQEWAAEQIQWQAVRNSFLYLPGKDWTNERLLEGNQSDFSATAGSKESQAEGWKEGKERKSATPGGDFFSSPIFPRFSSNSTHSAACRAWWNMGFSCRRTILFQGANRLCGLKAELGFKQKHHRVKEATSLPHNPEPTLALLTQLQKHREETITDESFRLTRSRPGNTCRRRRGHSPRARDGRKCKKGRLWRRGGNVSLRRESNKHAVQRCCSQLSLSPLHIPLQKFKKREKNLLRQQGSHEHETQRE